MAVYTNIPPVSSGGSSGGWRATYEARAATLLGSSALSTCFRGFQEGLWGHTQNLVGASGVAQALSIPDTTDAVVSLGGACTFGTGSAVNGVSELYRGAGDGSAGLAPFLASADVTKKFYYATSFQLSSAADANVACGVGVRNWLVGAFGANSTTNYSVRIGTSGFHYITSTIAIDTAFHIMETWHDGSSGWICVDGETPVSLADTAFWPLTASNNSAPIYTFAKATAVATVYTGAVHFGFFAIKPI